MESQKSKRSGVRKVLKYRVGDIAKFGSTKYKIAFKDEMLGSYVVQRVYGFWLFTWLGKLVNINSDILDGFGSMRITAQNGFTHESEFNRFIEADGLEVAMLNRPNLQTLMLKYGRDVVVDRLTKAIKDQMERKITSNPEIHPTVEFEDKD